MPYQDLPRVVTGTVSAPVLHPGARVHQYEPSTQTRKTLYAALEVLMNDAGARVLRFSTPHPNPLIADSAARLPPMYFDSPVRLLVEDAKGNELFDLDPVTIWPGAQKVTPLADSGARLPFATLTFYESRATTLTPVGKVTADSSGEFAAIALDAATVYRVMLNDRHGRLIYDVDPYPGDGSALILSGPGVSQFVATTTFSSDAIVTSPDGITWTRRTTPAVGIGVLTDIAFAPEIGVYIATNTLGAFLRSTDSVNWSTISVTGHWLAVAWSPTLMLFVAVSNAGAIVTSPDGITWTSRTPAVGTTSLVEVKWDARTARFYAAGQGGTHRVQYSADGITWTRASGADASGGAYHIASSTVGSGDDLIVLLSQGDIQAFYSADGAVWSSVAAFSSGMTAVGYGNGRFVAGTVFGDRFYSNTGSSGWTAGSGAALRWADFAYSNSLGKFVGVDDGGGAGNFTGHSSDGIVWTAVPFPFAIGVTRIIPVFME